MPRYIAFLRAINVGGHTVKMDRLRALFGELGLGRVQTFIASGNVIFDSPSEEAGALEERIERHLEQALGYEVGTFVRTPAELSAVVAAAPEPAGQALTVLFLKASPEAGPEAEMLRKIEGLRSAADDFQARGREVFWRCGTRTSDSPAGVLLGRIVGKRGTMRNVTTVRKLAVKYAAQEGG
jgi:uncharacterized protein (DUF1697 family)